MEYVTAISKGNRQPVIIGRRRIRLIFDRWLVERVAADSALLSCHTHTVIDYYYNQCDRKRKRIIGVQVVLTYCIRADIPRPHCHRVPLLDFKSRSISRRWLCSWFCLCGSTLQTNKINKYGERRGKSMSYPQDQHNIHDTVLWCGVVWRVVMVVQTSQSSFIHSFISSATK